jgi:hypothetical protein
MTRFATSIIVLTTGMIGVQSAAAQIFPPKCLTMQPHAKRLLDAGRLGISGETSSTDYRQDPDCDYYVMEVAVPASSTAPPGFRPSFGFVTGAADLNEILSYPPQAPPDQGRCESYSEDTWIVKKSVANDQMMGPGGFKPNAWWSTHGFWVKLNLNKQLPAHCKLIRTAGHKKTPVFAPPKSGTDIYRVGVRVRTIVHSPYYGVQSGYWNVLIKASRVEDIR